MLTKKQIPLVILGILLLGILTLSLASAGYRAVVNSASKQPCDYVCETTYGYEKCVQIGTDGSGTNRLYWNHNGLTCEERSGDCTHKMSDDGFTCPVFGRNRAEWSNCRCYNDTYAPTISNEYNAFPYGMQAGDTVNFSATIVDDDDGDGVASAVVQLERPDASFLNITMANTGTRYYNNTYVLTQTGTFGWQIYATDSSAAANMGNGSYELFYDWFNATSGSWDLHDIYDAINWDEKFLNSSGNNECVYVANISIEISSGASLTIENCTFLIDSSDGLKTFDITGTLSVNNSNISRNGTSNYAFYSTDTASVTIKNTHISFAGDSDSGTKRRGVILGTSDTEFHSNTLSRNRAIVLEGNDISIENITAFAGGNTHNLRVRANNCTLTSSNLSGTTGISPEDVEIDDYWNMTIINSNFTNIELKGTNPNVTVINSYFSASTISSGSWLTRAWYGLITVVNSTGSTELPGANVTVYNLTYDFVETNLTDTSGLSNITVIEYIEGADEVLHYQTPHTVNVTHADFPGITTATFNITDTKNITISLDKCKFDCADSTVISTDLYCGGEDFTVSGNGSFTIDGASIHGYSTAYLGTYGNSCNIYLKNGGMLWN